MRFAHSLKVGVLTGGWVGGCSRIWLSQRWKSARLTQKAVCSSWWKAAVAAGLLASMTETQSLPAPLHRPRALFKHPDWSLSTNFIPRGGSWPNTTFEAAEPAQNLLIVGTQQMKEDHNNNKTMTRMHLGIEEMVQAPWSSPGPDKARQGRDVFTVYSSIKGDRPHALSVWWLDGTMMRYAVPKLENCSIDMPFQSLSMARSCIRRRYGTLHGWSKISNSPQPQPSGFGLICLMRFWLQKN